LWLANADTHGELLIVSGIPDRYWLWGRRSVFDRIAKQLDPNYPQPQHICELTNDLIQSGKIKVDPSLNDDLIVTYHDSCNVARASRMGLSPEVNSPFRAN